MMAFALGAKRPAVEAIMFRIRNIADRVEIIRAVALEAEHLDERQKFSVASACDRAAALNARRNVYSHGQYEHCGDKIRVRPFAFSTRSRQPEVLKLDRVKQDVQEIDGLLVATYLYAGLIPDELLGELDSSPETPQPPDAPKKPRTQNRVTQERRSPPRS